ncbi:MAG: hypothetical protein ABIJ16_01125 [Bacteroidota bacterium]
MLNSIIRTRLCPSGNYIWRIAGIKDMADEMFRDYPCAISIGRKPDHDIVNPVENGPTKEYYKHYRSNEISDT